jgi:hypothetical protein
MQMGMQNMGGRRRRRDRGTNQSNENSPG